MITIHNNVIFNPKRGIQTYSKSRSSNPSPLTQSGLNSIKTGATRSSVLNRLYVLDNFLAGPISSTYLNQIQADLLLLSQNNMSALIRFMYKDSYTSGVAQQPTKALILSHIEQIAPIVNAYPQAIMAFQMGFIGTYGEWYYTESSEFGTAGVINTTQWANRKEVTDKCLTLLSTSIPLQVRYVEAHTKVSLNNLRVGFYNDAFLNDYGDNGTFLNVDEFENPVGSADYELLREITQEAFMTGETNGVNSPRTDVSNALIELALCNWDTLNDAYHPTVINSWKSSPYWTDIVNKLGYRFQLETASFSYNATTKILSYNLSINNVGFAPLKFEEFFKIVAIKNGVRTALTNTPLKGIKGVHSITGQVVVSSLEGAYALEFESGIEFGNTSKSLFYILTVEADVVVDPDPTPTPIGLYLPINTSTLQTNGFTDFKVYDASNNFVGTNPTLRPYPRGTYKITCVKNATNFVFTVKK